MQIKLAIIILNYNSWQLTLSYIKDQLPRLTLPEDTQIIVVDNNSTNESAEKLKGGDYVFLQSKQNIGYAAGNNIGLRWAYTHGYNYAWVTNSDIQFEDSETALKMLEIFTAVA